jgi:hypothetical protein
MAEVGQVLGLTAAYVKGVVTFYTMYHQHPVGKHFIQVCTTTPCHVCGAEDVVKAFLKETGCGELGVTSTDGKYTVIEVECLGACRFRDAGDGQFGLHRVGTGEGAGLLKRSTVRYWTRFVLHLKSTNLNRMGFSLQTTSARDTVLSKHSASRGAHATAGTRRVIRA